MTYLTIDHKRGDPCRNHMKIFHYLFAQRKLSIQDVFFAPSGLSIPLWVPPVQVGVMVDGADLTILPQQKETFGSHSYLLQ